MHAMLGFVIFSEYKLTNTDQVFIAGSREVTVAYLPPTPLFCVCHNFKIDAKGKKGFIFNTNDGNRDL